MRGVFSRLMVTLSLALIGSDWSLAAAQGPPRDSLLIEALTDRTVTRLPDGGLHWRIEVFPTLVEARAAAGPWSLAAEHAGTAWLFTLGPKGTTTPGGQLMAEIGPVPVVAATAYLLRVNRASGPPGARTPVHSHPGSEAFYVLRGQLSQRTPHGVRRVDAGQTMNGHDPNIPMQLTSSGTVDLDQLVLFVVDASKPFSSPATFD